MMRGLNTKIIGFQSNMNNVGIKQVLDKVKRKGKIHSTCFLGIRNDYINIYFRGNSMMKVNFDENGAFKSAETHRKFWDENSQNNYVKIEDLKNININKIKTKINEYMEHNSDCEDNEDGKFDKGERELQQEIIRINNSDPNSKWYCVDMEYCLERDDGSKDNYGRFDIIALSTEPNKNGKYVIALVELKVGNKAFESDIKEEVKQILDNKIKGNEFVKVSDGFKLGSGIVGHFSDFVRYLEDVKYVNNSGRFDILKEEVISIMKTYQQLGLLTPKIEQIADKIKVTDLEVDPKVVFLLYSKSSELKDLKSIKNSFNNYVFSKDNEGGATYTIDKLWSPNVIEKYSKGDKRIECVFRTNNYKGPIFSDIDIPEANCIFAKNKYWVID